MKTRQERFHTLDGMRGVAALMVAAYHLAQRHSGTTFPGYLAVDLFFVISGFVIALNYCGKLAGGLTAARFTELRVVRLFPLYLAGLMLGLGKQLFGHALQDDRAIGAGMLACNAALGAFMLPSPCGPEMFPLNGPSWSLFFELLVNVLFALFLWRLRSAVLAAIMAVAAIYLAWVIGAPDYFNVGWGWENALQGAARTAFSFPAGILIFRFFPLQTRRTSWFALVPVVAMIALMLVDWPASVQSQAQLLIVFVGFPALVMAGIRLEAPRLLAPVFGFMGDLSYPLYAIHWPLIAIALPLFAKLHFSPSAAGLAFVAVLIPAAYAASVADKRARKLISDGLRLRRRAAAQAV